MTRIVGMPKQSGIGSGLTGTVRVIGVPALLAKLRGVQVYSRLELGKLDMAIALHVAERARNNINSITGNLASGTKAKKLGSYTWEVTSSSLDGTVADKNSKEYAGFVENGTSNMEARYYMRDAWVATRPEVQVGLMRIAKLIEAI